MAISGMSAGRILRADINMTPMIDVLLVLIIIFVVITPVTPKGLEALVPPNIESPSAAAQLTRTAHRGDRDSSRRVYVPES